ncbi:hypothetical protein GCM10018793_67240 [Streptomyces sulfonofaciens]|uniref:Uncharacterized protein n=1 Tax=Streptomyces sulfonofaciens TaxID=68272 RepID=A0A919GQK7_9ACTN|nr:DUF6338 family protein [Streptomyces sulfonofaciens]GHH88246.1 hypothetical protein GCM10018793_67240 [Streptomyces sulfonofaciens]
MGHTPSSALQVLLLVVFVLPGISYQFLRERLRGPVARESNLGERVLRAVTASIVLDSVYAVVLGPLLVRVVRGGGQQHWDGAVRQPRLAGLLALLLLVAVPAAAAGCVSLWQHRRLPARYRAAPSAWDHMFRHRGSCFVRVRLKDGTWVGGWYGSGSYATSYPEPAELFLESAWRMNPDGSFAGRIERTAGLHVRAADADIFELVHPPDLTTGPVPGEVRAPARRTRRLPIRRGRPPGRR